MNRPLTVVLADDEQLARQRIRRLLRRDQEVRIVAECADGAATVSAVLRDVPDLLFLDVQMPELDGFAVLRAIPPDRLPVTVFVTAYDQYALQAFEAQALDYLLKPFTEARFRTAFERARALIGRPEAAERAAILALLEQVRMEQREIRKRVDQSNGAETSERILVREEGRVRVIPVSEVEYLEAARNHVRVHAGRATHLLREPLSALEARLDPLRFARIHRSTVVNLDRVVEIQPWFSGDCMVVLHGGAKLRLSRSYRHEFEVRLGQSGQYQQRR
jgi:two-component system, LytTR family, response regulator